ncbi:hypothetical protein M427DRAFT_142760 [Gonapodya prolifera JEL478]|uniref:Uncharacterized protein n=1 Tax=Gonapodya prolifera (strain JEL478) TaxID=1344416 RepID=A0A139AV99_GONPJ|nr:hypothetical protein M427DRAFT_142760 [Gonapodya prolifera JEL478]|eukprot:KXS20503.1 hypothetical protein M427DRAFT_142760 [Gonapodya prolifera JEL478]
MQCMSQTPRLSSSVNRPTMYCHAMGYTSEVFDDGYCGTNNTVRRDRQQYASYPRGEASEAPPTTGTGAGTEGGKALPGVCPTPAPSNTERFDGRQAPVDRRGQSSPERRMGGNGWFEVVSADELLLNPSPEATLLGKTHKMSKWVKFRSPFGSQGQITKMDVTRLKVVQVLYFSKNLIARFDVGPDIRSREALSGISEHSSSYTFIPDWTGAMDARRGPCLFAFRLRRASVDCEDHDSSSDHTACSRRLNSGPGGHYWFLSRRGKDGKVLDRRSRVNFFPRTLDAPTQRHLCEIQRSFVSAYVGLRVDNDDSEEVGVWCGWKEKNAF